MFEEHRDPLFRFLYRLTRDPSDAEDLLQETFLVCWRKRAQYEARGSALAWLRRTGYRLYLNSRERRERREALAPTANGEVEPAHDPGRESERREVIGFLAERVREALDGLPERAREAFVLFRYESLSCAEIADVVGVPKKTVETRLRRATRLLSQRLAPYRHHMTSL